jgi:CheY-like chemotaxis protein
MPLRLLFLEDAHEDAELEQRVLRRAGIIFEALLVRDRAGFLQSLQTFQPDLVIADYSLSDINGLSAIELTREWDANLPVLLVTGGTR